MALGSSGNSTSASRHGRHSATSRAAGTSRPAAKPAVAKPAAAGAHTAASPGRARIQARIPVIGESEQDAPRPIGVDPAVTGSFQRIDPSMGATVTTRENVTTLSADSTASWTRIGYGAEMRLQGKRRPRVKKRERRYKTNKNLFIGLGVAAFVIVLIGGVLLWRALHSLTTVPEVTQIERTQIAVGEDLTYRGVTFRIQTTDEGKAALFSYAEGSEQGALVAELAGSPVQLVLYNGAILIPENLDGSWDVVAYTIGGSVSNVVDADGNPVGGSGQIITVELDDPNLMVTDDAGETIAVALA